jgi:hypothetical protein
MQVLHPVHRFRYSITPNRRGVTLCVWEVEKKAASSEQPFLFKVNHRLNSETEAQQLLQHYLEGAA